MALLGVPLANATHLILVRVALHVQASIAPEGRSVARLVGIEVREAHGGHERAAAFYPCKEGIPHRMCLDLTLSNLRESLLRLQQPLVGRHQIIVKAALDVLRIVRGDGLLTASTTLTLGNEIIGDASVLRKNSREVLGVLLALLDILHQTRTQAGHDAIASSDAELLDIIDATDDVANPVLLNVHKTNPSFCLYWIGLYPFMYI